MSETAATPIDLFEKARNHERQELLDAANEGGFNPYFHLLTSQASPCLLYTSDAADE